MVAIVWWPLKQIIEVSSVCPNTEMPNCPNCLLAARAAPRATYPFQETKTLHCKLMKEYQTDISEVVIFQNSFPALWLRQ